MNRKLCVILNPNSNAGRGALRWKKFLATSQALELGCHEAPTFDGRSQSGAELSDEVRKSQLEAWLREKLDLGFRDFLAAGGDGTVNAALTSLIEVSKGSPFRLGAVGLGSSNDFHKPFGVGSREKIAGLPCRVRFDEAYAHDFGEVDLPNGVRKIFAINASVGITAEANYYFNTAGRGFRKLKSTSVDAAIVYAALREFVAYRSFPLEIECQGFGKRKTRLVNLGVVKNPHFSGSFRYDSSFEPDSGLFDIHLCDSMNKAEALRTLIGLAKGKFQGLPKTSSTRASTVLIRSEVPFALETDGEVVRTTEAKITLNPKGVQLCP